MNSNVTIKEELNELLYTLKTEEINYHRSKIVHLSKSISLHPEKKFLSIKLQNSLRRLDSLLSA